MGVSELGKWGRSKWGQRDGYQRGHLWIFSGHSWANGLGAFVSCLPCPLCDQNLGKLLVTTLSPHISFCSNVVLLLGAYVLVHLLFASCANALRERVGLPVLERGGGACGPTSGGGLVHLIRGGVANGKVGPSWKPSDLYDSGGPACTAKLLRGTQRYTFGQFQTISDNFGQFQTISAVFGNPMFSADFGRYRQKSATTGDLGYSRLESVEGEAWQSPPN